MICSDYKHYQSHKKTKKQKNKKTKKQKNTKTQLIASSSELSLGLSRTTQQRNNTTIKIEIRAPTFPYLTNQPMSYTACESLGCQQKSNLIGESVLWVCDHLSDSSFEPDIQTLDFIKNKQVLWRENKKIGFENLTHPSYRK
jgi:hypothetical protein